MVEVEQVVSNVTSQFYNLDKVFITSTINLLRGAMPTGMEEPTESMGPILLKLKLKREA